MRGESSPTIIPDEQMARFRFMLDYSEEAICMNSAPLARGEKVRVVKGPLTGLVGELVTVDGRSKIAVRLNMFGVLVRICRLGMWNRLNKHRIKATLCLSQNSLLIF